MQTLSRTGDPGRPTAEEGGPTGGAPRLPYLPGVDGLRGLSVTAVVLYHAGVAWIPGGFLGVEIFFVISGYLITAQLDLERRRSGSIALRRFWARRARRLLPALFAMLAVVAALWLVLLPGEVARVRAEIVAALTYVTNWHLIFSDQSYFESLGRPSPLRHLWSLAIEEQFYVVWPLLLTGLFVIAKGSRARVIALTGGLALASTLLAAALFAPDADPSRVYYGLDTRATGLLVGAALAMAVPPWRLVGGIRRSAQLLIETAGLASLGLLGYLALHANEFDPFIYQGGFALVGLASAVTIFVVAHPASRMHRVVLSWRPLVWLGTRSYAVYLWHWPVFVLTRPGQDVPLDGLTLLVVRVGITLLLAEASYRLVETPWRTRPPADLRRRMPADPVERRERFRRRRLGVGGAIAMLAALTVGLVAAQASPPEAPPERAVTIPATGGAHSGRAGAAGVPSGDQPVGTPADFAAAFTAAARPGDHVTLIGDSVSVGAADTIAATLPGILIDAEMARQFWDAPDLVRSMRADGRLRSIVVVQLGTNGVVHPGPLDELLDELGESARVVVVTTKVPRPWESLSNDRLRRAPHGRPNVVVADWNASSSGHDGYFVDDGVHLTTDGARTFADLVADSIT
jgi:peptidoglycan/LPS O-acetylase OafA/YrhL